MRGIAKPVQRCGEEVVELAEGARAGKLRAVEQVREAGELGQGFGFEGNEEHPRV